MCCGYIEGMVDLLIFVGLKLVGVLCELMNLDGMMMCGDDVECFV